MFEQFNIWEFIAGLGIFLLGMMMLENALSTLAGRTFKKFLRKYTNHPIKAVLSGTVVTSILQSSSVVSLMVLAFVGAGIIQLKNAIGIIMGSNLGTTFTGWIVAYVGFQFDIENYALPLVGIGGLGIVYFQKGGKLNDLCRMLIGLGFLLMGLEYMKSSIELFATTFDLAPYVSYGPYFLFLISFALTAVIQSSSATMVITLSALNAGIIPLVSAGAMIIGGDLGTTITVLFGGIRGTAAKKRVAISHFLFNLIVDVLALLFLYPLILFVTDILQIHNPLYSLVVFHSLFNLLGILLFLPFIGLFARFLERKFNTDISIAQFIKNVPTEVPEIGIEALQKEIHHLLNRIFQLNFSILSIESIPIQQLGEDHSESTIKKYEHIKELEGELVEFYVNLQKKPLRREDSIRLKQLILAVRFAMTAAKGIKDISHNLDDFDRSINNSVLQIISTLKIQQQALYLELHQRVESTSSTSPFESLAYLRKKSKSHYNIFLDKVYQAVRDAQLSDIEISTLFNVNREIHNANKNMILAIKELLLKDIQSQDFDIIPDPA